jgi:SnoaL-like domain
VLRRVKEGKLKLVSAAGMLEMSYRQAKRIWADLLPTSSQRRWFRWLDCRVAAPSYFPPMEVVLASLHEDVIWANGMEGGHVHGRDGVRSYWTRQWAKVDPRVEPVGFSTSSEGEKVIVEVHQIVRDRQGNVIVDQMVGHIFQIENGLVKRFDIRGE